MMVALRELSYRLMHDPACAWWCRLTIRASCALKSARTRRSPDPGRRQCMQCPCLTFTIHTRMTHRNAVCKKSDAPLSLCAGLPEESVAGTQRLSRSDDSNVPVLHGAEGRNMLLSVRTVLRSHASLNSVR